MSDKKSSWEIDDLVDKDAGKIYECLFCLGLPKHPKFCTTCEHVFCEECLAGYTNTKACPYRCPNPTYMSAPKLVMRAINELKIHCNSCDGVFPIDQIDKHSEQCDKPKCGCQDCKVLQQAMTHEYNFDGKKFCSITCKYVYMAAKQLEKAGTPDAGGIFKSVDSTKFCSEVRNVISQLIKDPEIAPPKPVEAPPVLPAYPAYPAPRHVDMASSYSYMYQSHASASAPMQEVSVPTFSSSGVTDFKWDPEHCAQNITLSEDNRACFLMEGGYCFRTAIGTVGFMGGIHYWEIQADSRTENELKIGVACKKNFNLNTAFCDYDYGWGYYGLGQLRHGNNSSGPKFGKTFKNSGTLGVCLDMVRGQLSFALNGEHLGPAFKDENLRKGPIFPAVSLLHKAGCKLVVGKALPSYFTH